MKTVTWVVAILWGSLFSPLARATDPVTSPISVEAPSRPDFVILSYVVVKDGAVADFKKALLPYAALTRLEPGNLAYIIHQSPDDEHKFVTYEHWRSAADRAQHLAAPYAVQFLGDAPKLYFEPGYPVRENYQIVDPL